MPKRLLSGKVVSSKNNKSIVVEVTRRVKHKLYKKIIKRVKRYHAHDEANAYKMDGPKWFWTVQNHFGLTCTPLSVPLR